MSPPAKPCHLPRSLAAYGSPAFADILKAELGELDSQCLPLQQGLRNGSTSLDHKLSFMLLTQQQNSDHILVKLGMFYSSIIAGCSCADDPTPQDEVNEYGEIHVRIARDTAEARISLADT
ncbi:MAG: hypothetical protein K0A95_02335 [Chromatiales bacterium]|nr:hypothetical protein [Gammaproteobacteria bacterium]MBW6475894.1 hypothetical protein [Chromatiales bacterium]